MVRSPQEEHIRNLLRIFGPQTVDEIVYRIYPPTRHRFYRRYVKQQLHRMWPEVRCRLDAERGVVYYLSDPWFVPALVMTLVLILGALLWFCVR